jgi:DHA3 family macrolide efflux protein-like MFS transporter
VLTLGIFIGLVLGLAAGGSLANLASIRLRWIWALSIAVIVRFLTEAALAAGVDVVETFRVPLFAASFGILLAGLWVNRSFPGLSIAFVGIASNAVVILVNGGYMPIWEPSLALAGFTPEDVRSAIHTILPATLDADFLLALGPFADVIPIPFPIIRNVASVGDVFLTVGLGFFLFAATLRPRGEAVVATSEALAAPRVMLQPSIVESVALERPLILGAPAPGTAGTTSALPPFVLEPIPDAVPAVPALPRPAPPISERVRHHPYVRLALNSSFAALWTGQIVSLFGDRLHQVALAVLVLVTTNSALAAGAVFLVATLPNVLFGPFAGTLVDRWEHKEVMIVSDLLRASIVLVIPIAINIHVGLVYPLVFLVTTISIFFRPARVAILPRIVEDEDDLITANSALWVAETSADVIGYPLAAVFVAALGTALPLAFWIDAATYVGSAVLLSAVIVTPRVKPAAAEIGRSFTRELRDGWRFLRNEPALYANTLQATVGQITIGATIALSVVYAERVLDGSFGFDFSAIYGFLETGIGLGNLIGGFVIGLIGARIAKGRTIILGYVLEGLCVFLLAFATELPVAVGLMFGVGVANMIFVIPSQTLFQQRTPNDLLARVVSFRFALVSGAMTLAMGAGGLFADIVSVQVVLGAFGLLTIGAGLAGFLSPELRDA